MRPRNPELRGTFRADLRGGPISAKPTVPSYRLHRQSGQAGSFFLSSRTVARLLLMSQSTAVRRLARLVKAGELVLVERGTRATGLASVYRYAGPSFGALGKGGQG